MLDQILGRHISTLTVATVNAIVRDMENPLFPSRIVVFCDRCDIDHEGEYLVREEDDKATRYGYARAHLVAHERWSCDERGDFCPEHTPPKVGDTVEYAGEDEVCTGTVVELGKPEHQEVRVQDHEGGDPTWILFIDLTLVRKGDDRA
jgi:hypothetical protein